MPVSEVRRERSATLIELASGYVAAKWPTQAANSRRSTIEALATACASFAADLPGRPSVAELRRLLTVNVLPPIGRRDELTDEQERAVTWLRKVSRPVGDLTEQSATRTLLDGLPTSLDGSIAAATVIGRKVLSTAGES